MVYTLGIDLGTTFSAAAVHSDGRTQVVTLGYRDTVVPSVAYVGEDGRTVLGAAAVRRGAAEPERLARQFKRRVGDSVPLILGGMPLTAELLTARLLAWIVQQVTEQRGEPPAATAVTHPANWGAFKRERLADILRQAELQDVSDVVTLTEPEAAAISYAAAERVPAGEVVAVYDLGGGTFDASVLRKTVAGFEVLGTPSGVEHLGGVDVDEAVFAHVTGALGDDYAALGDDEATLRAVARLRADCVDAKEALSADTQATISVALPGLLQDVRITRAELEAMVRPLLEESVSALRRTITSAGLTPANVDRVLLVGGASRMPLVGELVGEALGRPVFVDAHPKHATALGAALAAQARLLARDTAPAPSTPPASAATAPPTPATPPGATPSPPTPHPPPAAPTPTGPGAPGFAGPAAPATQPSPAASSAGPGAPGFAGPGAPATRPSPAASSAGPGTPGFAGPAAPAVPAPGTAATQPSPAAAPAGTAAPGFAGPGAPAVPAPATAATQPSPAAAPVATGAAASATPGAGGPGVAPTVVQGAVGPSSPPGTAPMPAAAWAPPGPVAPTQATSTGPPAGAAGPRPGGGSGDGSRRLPLLIGGALAAVLAVVAIALANGGGDDDPETTPSSEQASSNETPTSAEPDSTTTTASTTTTQPTTTTTAAPTPQPLTVASASASTTAPAGNDACQTPTSFGAGNAIDGQTQTAWRATGDATGQTLTFNLGGQHRVLEVGLVPGYDKVDPCDGTDRWSQNRRPTRVTWTFGDGTTVEQTLADEPQMQTVPADAETSTVQLRIDGVTGDPERDFTAISEVTIEGVP